jgi:hypothetical protein
MITAAPSVAGPSSSNAPPLGSVEVEFEDPDVGHMEKSLHHDEEMANVNNNGNGVEEGPGSPSQVAAVPHVQSVEVDHVHNDNEVGEMILDEVEGDMGVYANVDEEIAEVLAKEEAGSGEDDDGFVGETVETLGVSASSAAIAMECEVATLIMEDAANLKVKEEVDETMVPLQDAGAEEGVAQDPHSISPSVPMNGTMMTTSTSIVVFDPSMSDPNLAAAAFHSQLSSSSFAIKEEPESLIVNNTSDQQCKEPAHLGVKLEASVDDVTDTSVGVMEGGLSTQPSSEALKAC